MSQQPTEHGRAPEQPMPQRLPVPAPRPHPDNPLPRRHPGASL